MNPGPLFVLNNDPSIVFHFHHNHQSQSSSMLENTEEVGEHYYQEVVQEEVEQC